MKNVSKGRVGMYENKFSKITSSRCHQKLFTNKSIDMFKISEFLYVEMYKDINLNIKNIPTSIFFFWNLK